MKRKLLLLTICFFLFRGYVRAQDQLYSQFYNAPIYLNPALTGQFDGSFRMNLIYRNQWTNIPGNLNYYTLSADLNLPEYNSGVGLMVTKSSEGLAYLNKVNFSGLYSYKVNFENSTLYFGLQAGVTNRSVDFDKLVFFDQLSPQGIIPGGTTAATYALFNHKYFFDSGAGVNYVFGDVQVGLAAQHLNEPNETLTGVNSPLAVRWGGYASWIISTNSYNDESPSVIPSVVYETQAAVKSYSVGMQFKKSNINVGLWYRGTGGQGSSVVISLIFDIFNNGDNNKYRLGVSHDLTVSGLGYANTAGSTEGALSYESTFQGSESDRSETKGIGRKCYDFY